MDTYPTICIIWWYSLFDALKNWYLRSPMAFLLLNQTDEKDHQMVKQWTLHYYYYYCYIKHRPIPIGLDSIWFCYYQILAYFGLWRKNETVKMQIFRNSLQRGKYFEKFTFIIFALSKTQQNEVARIFSKAIFLLAKTVTTLINYNISKKHEHF